MPWNEIDEGDLLLYVSGALPPAKRAWIFLRAGIDPRLSRRLRLLAAENGEYLRRVQPGLARRLAARLPAAPASGTLPTTLRGWFARAVRAWRESPIRPKAVFAGIALSSLLAASVLIFQAGGLAPDGIFLPIRAEGYELPRPLLILGY